MLALASKAQLHAGEFDKAPMRTTSAWIVGLFFMALSQRVHAQDASECDRAIATFAHALTEQTAAAANARADLIRRARWSGLVPSLRLGVRRGFGQGLSGAYFEDTQTNSRLTVDASFSFDASLTFSLERLVFAPEETAIRRATDAQAQEQDMRLAHAFDLLAQWQDAGLDTLARRTLAARLDAMTGGHFARLRRSAARCFATTRDAQDDAR